MTPSSPTSSCDWSSGGQLQLAAAFATPTIVNFSTVLFLSAVLCAPWHQIEIAIGVCCLTGVAGAGYTALVARRMRTQSAYRPELEDWVFHPVLPFVTYAWLLASSLVVVGGHARDGLFGIGAAELLLLFIGIHNAWDAVIYHAFVSATASDKDQGVNRIGRAHKQ